MNLSPGSRLGPYEILAPLGAGGMGEVYRARDTKLGREIAVKVLPAETSSDPERRRRFEQEARAARTDRSRRGRHGTPWKELRLPDPAGVLQVGPVVITPDGKSYVYSYRRILEELYLVTGLK